MSSQEPKTDCGSHEFSPINWTDRRSKGRCKGCYLPRWMHPCDGWQRARPLGDKSRVWSHWVKTDAALEVLEKHGSS